PLPSSGRSSTRRRAYRRRRVKSSAVSSATPSRRCRTRLAAVAVVPFLAACAVGPRYRRPAVPTPETTRGERGPGDAASLADSPWWAIFRDPALQVLVEEAIRGSHDLRAAAARVEQARNQIVIARADMFPQVSYQGEPVRERQIVAKENQLATLLGRPPGYIARGVPLEGKSPAPEVPVGLPSQLLERRPDIQQAEQALVAANADVGVAVANFFPRLGLSSLYGGQSSELENVVKSAGNVWAVAGSLAGPIFQGGRLLASYRATSAAWDEAVERYQQA